MLYQNLPDYRNRVRPQPLAARRAPVVVAPKPEPARQERRGVKWPLAALFVIFLLGAIGLPSFGGPHGVAQAFNALTTSAAAKEAAARTKRVNTYTNTVNALIAAHGDEDIAVSTIDVTNNASLTLGDHGTFTAASTAKVLSAVVLLHEIERGQLDLDTDIDGQTARTLLTNMIVDSDNDAWQAINDYVSHETLSAYASQLGWQQYDPDDNSLLPADMAKLDQKLFQGQLLNKSHTSLLLSLMQQANKQEYIVDSVKAINPSLTVYHKAGWLDGLMHDAAIITNGKQTIVLAIYTYNSSTVGDGPENQSLFKDITQAALTAYFPGDNAGRQPN